VLPVRSRTLPPASCTNVWMPGAGRFVVIDPGSGEDDEIQRLLAVVAKRRSAGSSLEAVLLTHHHRDHVAGCARVAEALGVPVVAHAETLVRLPELPRGVATRSLDDGALIDLDGLTLRAVHTPGHAPGHLAFYEPGRRVLIAGDLVSGLSTILVGFADGDMDDYLDALRRAAALDPKTVLPAHGPPLPGRSLEAAIAHREEREGRVLGVLADGRPRELAAIAEAAYADAPDAPSFLREMQARAHLARLMRHGQVERAGESYRSAGIGIPGISSLS
jgi:ribonuclease/clavin/mitogillin